jgi:hypothetical protein
MLSAAAVLPVLVFFFAMRLDLAVKTSILDSLKKIDHAYTKTFGDPLEALEGGVTKPPLHSADVSPVETGFLSERLLRNALALAEISDAPSNLGENRIPTAHVFHDRKSEHYESTDYE